MLFPSYKQSRVCRRVFYLIHQQKKKEIMCFIIENEECHIAYKDIVCYKVVHLASMVALGKVNCDFISLYFHKKYKNRHTYKMKWKFDPSKPLRRGTIIDKGFHSYSCEETARSVCNPFIEVIIRCKIPKGTKFYRNDLHKEYVSEAIYIEGTVEYHSNKRIEDNWVTAMCGKIANVYRKLTT